MIDGWKVYNHALIPTTKPNEEPNLEVLKNKSRRDLRYLLVRYTTNFDCKYETNWWYVIKDDEMDISKLKKKRRYEITKGLNNFDVRKISPKEYAEQLYIVYFSAFQNYSRAGKVTLKENFIEQCKRDENETQIEYFGAFDKISGEMAGYALNYVFEDYVNLSVMKFAPNYLSKNVSAALVYTILCEYLNIQNKKYVNDGERSIRHITNFQDYLIKYFGFRKAYCNLHVHYRPIVGIAVKMLFPFKKLIKRFPSNSTLHNVKALLDMEAIRRSFRS